MQQENGYEKHGNVNIYEADGRSKAANVRIHGMGGLPGDEWDV